MSDLLIDDFDTNLKPERIQFTQDTPFPDWFATKNRKSASRRFEVQSVQEGAELALEIAETADWSLTHLYMAFDHEALMVVIAQARGERLGDAEFELMAAVELAWDKVSQG